jgi:hypothetical protein
LEQVLIQFARRISSPSINISLLRSGVGFDVLISNEFINHVLRSTHFAPFHQKQVTSPRGLLALVCSIDEEMFWLALGTLALMLIFSKVFFTEECGLALNFAIF